MIASFGSKDTEKIWEGESGKNLPNEIQHIVRRKLRILNNSQNIVDLQIPPSNRLEKLKGECKECYSICINNQWRIIFKWDSNSAKFWLGLQDDFDIEGGNIQLKNKLNSIRHYSGSAA